MDVTTSYCRLEITKGPNARTHLASPVMAAAAVTGKITHVRRL
jgi:homoaconitase/3-isopropylmalate dehydratase large subunit